MPLYEYRCNSCGGVLEVLQKFSDEPLTLHEKCGGALERLVSASALQFKGTGWYITDYARGGNGADKSKAEKADKADKGDKPADSTKSDTAKSETTKSSSEPAASSTPKTSSDK